MASFGGEATAAATEGANGHIPVVREPKRQNSGDSDSSAEELQTQVTTLDAKRPGLAVDTTTYSTTGRNLRGLAHSLNDDGSLTLRPLSPSGLQTPAKMKVHKRVIQFEPRVSVFDRDSAIANRDHFRGFFTLFWLMLGLTTIRTLEKSYRDSGYIVGTRFATLFSEDALGLAIADGVLVGSSILAVPFIQLIARGWFRFWWTGATIQHLGQALYLAVAVRWTFHRQWPWVQSGFLTLHALTMLMKLHSYVVVNGDLSHKSLERKAIEVRLEAAIKRCGGENECIDTAVKESDLADAVELTAETTSSEPPSREEPAPLRRRSKKDSDKSSSSRSKLTPSEERLWILREHPDKELHRLAAKALELEEALTSPGPKKIVWPANVTYINFIDYLLIPTLVYELEYPRTKSIRPLYVLEKIVATMGTFTLLYVVSEHYISPVIHNTDQSFLSALVDLAAPFLINYCLLFFIIFECICNGFAELTMFADRRFYDDWWNSTDFGEFSRKWNRPVHSFLLRHVYTSTLSSTTYKVSKQQAMFVTFLLSACLHELVMVVVTKKIRMYLFAAQILQLPMIAVGQMKVFKRNQGLGNVFFWIGLSAGFPLLGVAYTRV